MPRVLLVGWKPGLAKKVSLTRLIMDCTGLALQDAKGCTDHLLDGDVVTLDLPTFEAAERLAVEASENGAVVEIQADESEAPSRRSSRHLA